MGKRAGPHKIAALPKLHGGAVSFVLVRCLGHQPGRAHPSPAASAWTGCSASRYRLAHSMEEAMVKAASTEKREYKTSVYKTSESAARQKKRWETKGNASGRHLEGIAL